MILNNLFKAANGKLQASPSKSRNSMRGTSYKPGGKIIRMLKKDWQDYAAAIPDYPGGFEGRGIVTCAGNLRYFTCAWVGISMLRKRGCTLPIEAWYVDNEMIPEAIEAFRKLGVVCRNASDYPNGSKMAGFALKPFAILNSSFKEVLFLDADNLCTTDPAYLFDSKEFRETGAIFWPDMWHTGINNPIWKIVDSNDYDSYEQESGQIMINKEKCWKAMNLCMYFNLQKDYYYQMLYGDKDTFKFAWVALRQDYHMIRTPLSFCGYNNEREKNFFGLTMIQHDMDGKMIFIHRNLHKWDITSPDEIIWKEIRLFRKEDECGVVLMKYTDGNGRAFNAVNIKSETNTLCFKEKLGNIEEECLEFLTEIRGNPLYGKFLFHMYTLAFRPAYLHQ